MRALSNAYAKGRVFLFCLIIFCSCSANASGSDESSFPLVKDGKLYSYSSDELNSILDNTDTFTQKSVCVSKKSGWILAWNRKNQTVYHIDENKRVRFKTGVSGSLAYIDKKYILTQTSSFDENKGFGFTLYSIKYSWNGKKLSFKQVWSGFLDCFVSDSFFTADGVCVCGGTRDDSKHNVYYITGSGVHKCFSTSKNSDFLRLVNTDDKVYAFVSSRDKSAVEPVIYNFTLDDYIEGTEPSSYINLRTDSKMPDTFDCFFGFGFTVAPGAPEHAEGLLVLPASFDSHISFLCYDYKNGCITDIVPDAVGCVAVLGADDNGVWYMARDPLIEGSFYGISLFNGVECKKIKEIY